MRLVACRPNYGTVPLVTAAIGALLRRKRWVCEHRATPSGVEWSDRRRGPLGVPLSPHVGGLRWQVERRPSGDTAVHLLHAESGLEQRDGGLDAQTAHLPALIPEMVEQSLGQLAVLDTVPRRRGQAPVTFEREPRVSKLAAAPGGQSIQWGPPLLPLCHPLSISWPQLVHR